MNETPFHGFARAHAEAEIWWDAHPDLRDGSGPSEAFRPGSPASITRGVTTNPILLLAYWNGRLATGAAELRALLHRSGISDPARLADRLQAESLALAARALLPLHEASAGRYGWVSAQVPPRCFDDAPAMLEHGRWLAALAPNVMVKLPVCAAGLRAVEALVADGISVNCTLSYSVPQARSALAAIARGRLRAARGRPWRAVVTYMAGRFGDELRRQADHEGVALSPGDVRWAELVNAARQLELVSACGPSVKLLLCSLRSDSAADAIDGSFCAHLQHLAGRPVIVSCPPGLIAAVLESGGRIAASERRALDAPADVRQRLEALSWMRDGTGDGSMAPEDFAQLPAFRLNRSQHERAERQLQELVACARDDVA